jgi:hypothetical protein
VALEFFFNSGREEPLQLAVNLCSNIYSINSTSLKPLSPDLQWASTPTQAAFLFDKSLNVRINIDKRPFYVVGREPAMADIEIDAPAVSRRHAAIVFHGNNKRYYIIDLASVRLSGFMDILQPTKK